MLQVTRVQHAMGLLALAVLLGQPALAAEGPELTPAVAVDANGRAIGQVVRADYSLGRLLVAMKVQSQAVFVLVDGSTFSHSVNPVVFFELDECAGDAFMLAQDQAFGAASAVAGPNGTLYLGAAATIQIRPIASAQWSSSCVPFSAEMPVIQATPVVDLNAQFTPPFRVVAPSLVREPAQ